MRDISYRDICSRFRPIDYSLHIAKKNHYLSVYETLTHSFLLELFPAGSINTIYIEFDVNSWI